MVKFSFKRFNFLILFFLSLFIVSCSSTKNTKYFQDIPDSGKLKIIGKAEYNEPKVQVDDILTILVETVDPTATAMINFGNVPVSSGSSSGSGSAGSASAAAAASLSQAAPAGFLVDKNGDVEIPVLGKISVAGHTTSEVRDIVLARALKFYNDPTVIVRYANFKVSVTGEVFRPGQYIMPNEKVSILDAIAMAGDLTIYGKRDNVLLVRENADGTKTPYRVNLKKSDIMSSPYYYLKQNDIIYVEPSGSKAAATDATQARTFTIIGSVLTVIIVLLTRTK